MARVFVPKVVTANHLLEGDVIYQTSSGEWTRDHSKAALYEDEETAQQALKRASAQVDEIVGAYLADAELDDGKPKPVHFREVFRTRGPSNYTNHGKQAEA